MKFSIMLAALTVLASTQALAMPNWDGTYTCSVPGKAQTVQVTFTTSGDKLYLSGADLSGKDGIPCANDSSSQSSGAASIQVRATCNDSELDFIVSAKDATQGTDLRVESRVTQVAPNKVDIFVSTAGRAQGKDANATVTISCSR